MRKLLGLRIFTDKAGKHWSESVVTRELEILIVSQFTLHAVTKGKRTNACNIHRSARQQT